MPEQPTPKIRPVPQPKNIVSPEDMGSYAELHCLTNYSFLQAASHPDELVQRAVELRLAALAITDRHSLAGVVRAHSAAKPLGLKLLIGSEITPQDGSTVVLLAMNRTGYGRLARLLTLGKRRAAKGECHLAFADIADCTTDLLACVLLSAETPEDQTKELAGWREAFGDRCYLLAQLHRGPHDDWLLQRYQQVSQQARLPLIASNGVLYHDSGRRYLHDVVTAVRLGCTVAELGAHRLPNGERHLKSAREMQTLFAAAPEIVRRSVDVAGRCSFSLDELRYEYPEELCPPDQTPLSWLTHLTRAGARNRYPEGLPDKVRDLIEHELRLIEELHYEAYFLTVWDLVRFARSRGILCQGRGSAANSVVCYCLEVTSINPEKIELLFERFISKERGEAPDIDVDFEHERREEVLQYLYEKYGRERAGMTAEVISYRPKSAVRDVGKALGLSLDCVDSLAKSVEHSRHEDAMVNRFRDVGFDPTSRLGRQLLILVEQLQGFPRHLSQHVGGMVITRGPLSELVPIENAAMANRTVIEWDKNDLDELGILKVDCLALGMLTAIRRGLDLIKSHKKLDFSLATIPAEDPGVYEMIQQADTIGVFQIESRAQMSMLPRLKPERFYDLVIEVAIVRPGPIQGDMVRPYLRRRSGDEEITYPNAAVESVLSRTLGVPLFQEQAMKLVTVAAGFSPGESDQLRRAMGTWRKTGVIEQFRQKMLDGMRGKGYTDEFAERLFNQIKGFGEYGFPESHAASFALLVYASSWIKRYHPDVFLVALLNSQPMGFYGPAQLVTDARKHGVEVRPPDVNHSEWDCTLESRGDESFAVRLGWRMIREINVSMAERIINLRRTGLFTSQADFATRTQFDRRRLSLLAKSDAFCSLKIGRRPALWEAMPARETVPLFAEVDHEEPSVTLPTMTPAQEVAADYQTTGLSLRAHPLAFLRADLNECRVTPAADLAHVESDRRYRVAGLVLLRQRPSTAKGITFMTLEDETGTANLVVHVNVWERFWLVARRASAMIAHGMLQRQHGTIHLIVDRMDDLTVFLSQIGNRSRDFR